MIKPFVSFIVPCYNHGHYLDQCLRSLKSQTYPNKEIIVVNDGSTNEETIRIINSLNDPGLKVINKANGGLAAARNTGIGACKGEIILPIDADDYLADSYAEKAVDILMSRPEVGLVSCRGKYFGTRENIVDNEYVSPSEMLLYNSLFHCAVFRKQDFNYVGGYNTNMTKGYEDWEFYLRMLAYKKSVVQIPEIMFFYRQREDSMLRNLEKTQIDRVEMENVLFKNNIDTYQKHYGSLIGVLREYEVLKKEEASSAAERYAVHQTASYKLGSFLLSPFKIFKKFLKK